MILIIPAGVLMQGFGWGAEYSGLAVTALGITASIVIVGRYIDRRRFDEFGIQTTGIWKRELWEGTAIGIVAMAGIWVLLWLLGFVRMDGFGWNRPSDQFWLTPILGNMFLMMVVGFYEEYWTRGYQMKVLAEGLHVGSITPRVAVGAAVVITSIFFGVLHAGNPNASLISTVNITLAGMMLALPYVLTGRLWVSIGLHFSWNFFQGAVFGFPVSGKSFRTSVVQTIEDGPDWFTGGEFGPEAGAVGLLAMVLITLWMYRRFKPDSLDARISSLVEPPREP
jgi:membrane protease YdiL (CAAX protease family)